MASCQSIGSNDKGFSRAATLVVEAVMNIRGRADLVTGASRGLGRALAEELAARGARVALVARGSVELEKAAAAIRAAGGIAHALPGDIADKSAVFGLAGAAASLVGPLDLLVHNASVLGPVPLRLLLDTECEDFHDVLEANLVGPFRLTKIVVGSMALRGQGVVVHLSSDAAVAAYPRWGAYGVSKAAQDHLSRQWAAELGELGVRVFSVDPGEMDTEMHACAMPDADRSRLATPRSVARRIAAMIESGKIPSGSRLIAPTWEPA
jgi:NAD(P)-dependent dehydrogenase (short-subunit alcohol dehydrogenase family)